LRGVVAEARGFLASMDESSVARRSYGAWHRYRLNRRSAITSLSGLHQSQYFVGVEASHYASDSIGKGGGILDERVSISVCAQFCLSD